jgi:hypothetical protein
MNGVSLNKAKNGILFTLFIEKSAHLKAPGEEKLLTWCPV